MGVWRRRHAAPVRSPAWAIAYGSCGSPAVSSLPTVTEGPSLNIIGISGFEGSIPFKRARSPNLDEREYRISQGHDSAAGPGVAPGEGGGTGAEQHNAPTPSPPNLA